MTVVNVPETLRSDINYLRGKLDYMARRSKDLSKRFIAGRLLHSESFTLEELANFYNKRWLKMNVVFFHFYWYGILTKLKERLPSRGLFLEFKELCQHHEGFLTDQQIFSFVTRVSNNALMSSNSDSDSDSD